MVYAHQVREVALRYAQQAIDSEVFLQQFSALSHNIHKTGGAEAIRLTRNIESMLVDVRSGCMTESQFRSSLRDLSGVLPVNTMMVPVTFPETVNQMVVAAGTFQMAPASADTLPAVVFGSAELLPLRY